MKPLLHPRTKRLLEQYMKQPTHGLILAGEDGIGKLHVALWLTEQQNLTPYTVEPEEDKRGITIAQIRELYSITRTGGGLMVIIKDAQLLGRDAQNAFLKLLEEPPANTWFTLTVNNTESLLSTIRSRCQTIVISTPLQQDLSDHIQMLFPRTEVDLLPLLRTTKYLPGKTIELLHDEEKKGQHNTDVAEAKKFYGSTEYQRHITCIQHAYDRNWTQNLLEFLAIITQTLMKAHAENGAALHKLKSQAQLIEETSRRIHSINGNPKIHMARLCKML